MERGIAALEFECLLFSADGWNAIDAAQNWNKPPRTLNEPCMNVNLGFGRRIGRMLINRACNFYDSLIVSLKPLQDKSVKGHYSYCLGISQNTFTGYAVAVRKYSDVNTSRTRCEYCAIGFDCFWVFNLWSILFKSETNIKQPTFIFFLRSLLYGNLATFI